MIPVLAIAALHSTKVFSSGYIYIECFYSMANTVSVPAARHFIPRALVSQYHRTTRNLLFLYNETTKLTQ